MESSFLIRRVLRAGGKQLESYMTLESSHVTPVSFGELRVYSGVRGLSAEYDSLLFLVPLLRGVYFFHTGKCAVGGSVRGIPSPIVAVDGSFLVSQQVSEQLGIPFVALPDHPERVVWNVYENFSFPDRVPEVTRQGRFELVLE